MSSILLSLDHKHLFYFVSYKWHMTSMRKTCLVIPSGDIVSKVLLHYQLSIKNRILPQGKNMKKIVMLSLLLSMSPAFAWGHGCCGSEETTQEDTNGSGCSTCSSYGKVERQCSSCNNDNLQARCPNCPKNDQ